MACHFISVQCFLLFNCYLKVNSPPIYGCAYVGIYGTFLSGYETHTKLLWLDKFRIVNKRYIT